MEENSKPRIWIDADACPKVIKDIIYKASSRLKIEVLLVANDYMKIPEDPLISLVKVGEGADVADRYIINEADRGDLVITGDIPLAAELVKKGVLALDHRGDLFDEENISERLSVRNLMDGLRSGGLITGGPKAFNLKDKARFASAFDRIITKLSRK